LDPPLRLPEPPQLGVVSEEEPTLLAYAQHWEKDLRASLKKYNDRTVQAMCLDLTGLKVLLPRYIFPQQPPAVFTREAPYVL
jgi:hypothetical protein